MVSQRNKQFLVAITNRFAGKCNLCRTPGNSEEKRGIIPRELIARILGHDPQMDTNTIMSISISWNLPVSVFRKPEAPECDAIRKQWAYKQLMG